MYVFIDKRDRVYTFHPVYNKSGGFIYCGRYWWANMLKRPT